LKLAETLPKILLPVACQMTEMSFRLAQVVYNVFLRLYRLANTLTEFDRLYRLSYGNRSV
jgi:hypothetical protein